MIFIRVRNGILDHWPIRATEWIFTAPLFGMYFVLSFWPNMMAEAPTFQPLLGWARQDTWATLLLGCAAARLAALTINGTFKQFRFSPHIRFLASALAFLFWANWTIAIVFSVVYYNGTPSGIIAYGTFILAELRNIRLATIDTGIEINRFLRTVRK